MARCTSRVWTGRVSLGRLRYGVASFATIYRASRRIVTICLRRFLAASGEVVHGFPLRLNGMSDARHW